MCSMRWWGSGRLCCQTVYLQLMAFLSASRPISAANPICWSLIFRNSNEPESAAWNIVFLPRLLRSWNTIHTLNTRKLKILLIFLLDLFAFLIVQTVLFFLFISIVFFMRRVAFKSFCTLRSKSFTLLNIIFLCIRKIHDGIPTWIECNILFI